MKQDNVYNVISTECLSINTTFHHTQPTPVLPNNSRGLEIQCGPRMVDKSKLTGEKVSLHDISVSYLEKVLSSLLADDHSLHALLHSYPCILAPQTLKQNKAKQATHLRLEKGL
jgi:hypothetical protein